MPTATAPKSERISIAEKPPCFFGLNTGFLSLGIIGFNIGKSPKIQYNVTTIKKARKKTFSIEEYPSSARYLTSAFIIAKNIVAMSISAIPAERDVF